MKKVYLVHGWGGSDSSEGWFGWIKGELKKRKIELIAFNMPNTNEPKIDEWVGFLKNNVKNVDNREYHEGSGCPTCGYESYTTGRIIIKCLNKEHTDNNPSLRIHKISGLGHCFACGYKLNIFKHF